MSLRVEKRRKKDSARIRIVTKYAIKAILCYLGELVGWFIDGCILLKTLADILERGIAFFVFRDDTSSYGA